MWCDLIKLQFLWKEVILTQTKLRLQDIFHETVEFAALRCMSQGQIKIIFRLQLLSNIEIVPSFYVFLR